MCLAPSNTNRKAAKSNEEHCNTERQIDPWHNVRTRGAKTHGVKICTHREKMQAPKREGATRQSEAAQGSNARQRKGVKKTHSIKAHGEGNPALRTIKAIAREPCDLSPGG